MVSQRVIVLDGGMGCALRLRVPSVKDDPLWSARLLLSESGCNEVTKLHGDFLSAGADVITTSNYSCVPEYLDRSSEPMNMEELTMIAIQAAKRAVDLHGKPAKIAMSLPPLRQSYSPVCPPNDEALQVYSTIARVAAPHIDFFLAETVSIGSAAVVPALVAEKEKKDFYVAYTVGEKGHLRSGEESFEAVKLLKDVPKPKGVLFNCSSPSEIRMAIERFVQGVNDDDMPDVIGGYANSLAPIPENWHHHRDGAPHLHNLREADYCDDVRQWIEAAMKHPSCKQAIVGGCCGILPQHIEHLSEMAATFTSSPP
eukprot:TRINITY_DN9196_c6_g1_i1.p1 TRINITY_DN9196_c6_g1~~TRINITY_DN9196_c6_g1_i1.p1  ORF type:complete len:313 (+),score=63.69 TRINITY_DN9196_c6_g1_i1:81-1019(+)